MMRSPLQSVITIGMLWLANVVAGATGEPLTPKIQNGEDWTLPAWVKPKPYSGLYTMDSAVRHPLITHIGTTLTWADLNPREAVYDFSLLEKYLVLAKERGGMVLFRLKASIIDAKEQGVYAGQRQMIPQWVVDKHHPKQFRTRAEKLYVAPWDPGVQAEFRRLVQEIGRRRYLESPQFLAIYLHGVSNSFGEEMNIDDEKFTDEAKAAGLTEEVLLNCWKARMDWWAEAAGPNISKVIWVGAGQLRGLPYSREELDGYALHKGLGWRAGFIEHYFYPRLHPPLAGQRYENGYIIADPHAPIRDGRYFGDENETNEFPQAKGEARDVVARSPYFRAVQAGLNFLWISHETLDWVGARGGSGNNIATWYTLLAGKSPTESPEAACWLREATIRGLTGPEGAPWKNLEFLLWQRDIPGAMSVAAERYAMPYVQLKDRQKTDEFTARRTDRSHQQDQLAFFLAREFRESLKGPVAVKVHYRDNEVGTWTVSVPAGAGQWRDLGVVNGRGDHAWRTATFHWDAAVSPNHDQDEPDFFIRALTGGDVTVRYVRVVRTRE